MGRPDERSFTGTVVRTDRRSPPVDGRAAWRVEVHGTVQGVGFRPFVHRLANSLAVDGWVRNDNGRVVLAAAGSPATLTTLATRLRTDAPPRSRVDAVVVAPLNGPAPRAGSGFHVDASTGRGDASGAVRQIPPDLATCDRCLTELFDPADRRYRYPFLNCVDCGPRATIVDTLPYDRERTAMRSFTMCADCARQYADPADRRFHAEPIACPACGPRLAWWPDGSAPQPVAAGAQALRAAEALVRAGGILALKGLGGFQLVCAATDEAAVARLRARKHRPAKPFAVMVSDLVAARRIARVDDAEAALLTSVARPVVLLDSLPDHPLADAVAVGSPRLGLFLPCTPLHHLLLADLTGPLVVTSGNLSDEPIAIDDAEARARLGGVADGFLGHDRPIRARYDDSVTRVVAGRASVLRRARGYAPEPIALPVPTPAPLLAVGAQLKHTFTLASGETAVVGPHTGDLEQQSTMDAFTGTLAHLSTVVGIVPEVVAHDLHPGYLSTQYAGGLAVRRRIAVQHHHAHVASCAAEHGVTGPFLGVAYDGLGLGDDGTLWGGEVFVADLAAYRRVARFARAPLPGGAAAVRRPARMALGYLFGAEPLGNDAPGLPDAAHRHAAGALLDRLPVREVAVVSRMVARGVNCPTASSAGRLFDAVSALLGLRDDATYEGEGAIALEAAALGALRAGHDVTELPWRLVDHDALLVYDPRPTLSALLLARAEGVATGVLAARFQASVAAVTVALCTTLAARHDLRTVCLSGGVMQHQWLATTLLDALTAAGLEPLLNERVPVNDGGISYGQAAVAAARLRKG